METENPFQGQPNAMTGVCDDDVMEINNGRTSFELCGWNSGQHGENCYIIASSCMRSSHDYSFAHGLSFCSERGTTYTYQRGEHFPSDLISARCIMSTVYVDASDGDEPITLNFRLPSGLQSRMWEMRVVQLGFEQRAPIGCLQYFRSPNGTLRTFNYLPNGRYLADHDYLLCVRQERDMCGISYQPCTRDSFRIGPNRFAETSGTTGSNTIPATNAGNSSAVNLNDAAGSTNNSTADLVEGSGAGLPEQEMIFTSSNTNSALLFGRRCRDRILIPCDFEEFITVSHIQFLILPCGSIFTRYYKLILE